ncbi:MAG: hydrogenase accessory protein HypB [Acidobacteria bacterium]|nr:MAG: hydrogenase accessory protein HypB [Acidobacteriota bacterium]
MCRDCGCETGNRRVFGDAADHADGHGHHHHHHHDHDHDHDHEHEHDAPRVVHVHLPAGAEVHLHIGSGPPRVVRDAADSGPARAARRVALEQDVLAENDRIAAANRELLARHGAVALNLISSPGSGKTTLLERTLERLAGEIDLGVIVGDQQTDNDARRLAGRGAPVEQIETRSACHLDARRVAAPLQRMLDAGARLILVENVGNLVCPAAFDLGERFKVALLSVVEGEDKPLKYPVLFHDAPVVVITKLDLAARAGWDREACHRAIRAVNPDARILELAARDGTGLDAWCDLLRETAAGVSRTDPRRAAAEEA